ncbi:MAG: hypothetical protein AB1744_14815 [Candidatus Zixiibacteriota bacterium]
MRLAAITCAAVVFLAASVTSGESVPFNQCGVFEFIQVEGGCWRFLADDGMPYELLGPGQGDQITPGERVRLIGTLESGYGTICMVGICCVVVDSVLPCVSCCENRGNADGLIALAAPVNVSDVTFLVAYLFQSGPLPPCLDEGDVNWSGDINIADLTYLVEYLFQGGPAPPACP